jgi:formamidopyrimidine-DNA glycosylase
MPELPEVETMCRGLAPVVGRTIVSIDHCPNRRRPLSISPPLGTIRKRIAGHRVEGIERRGKRVILWLDDRQCLVIEPRMTGLVLLADPPTVEHLRYSIRFRGAPTLKLFFWDQRGLGRLQLFHDHQFEEKLGPAVLGPDALQVTARELAARLATRRSPLKVALLDQQMVAGIGNLYAAEILFVCKIDPRRAADSLSKAECQALRRAIRKVLLEAIRFEGSTLNDGTYRNALNEQGSYQNHHRVYNREGECCPRCQLATISRIVQSQRSTYFCPNCQK